MKAPNVFILATCRKRELLPYTELVFKTLRAGFPTARVDVFLNDPKEGTAESISEKAKPCGCNIRFADTIHHEWIEMLIEAENEPFYVVDTDVFFFQSFERFSFEAPLAGFRIPEFKDEFTNAITRSRLHTSLLYIDPAMVRKRADEYHAQFPVTPFNPLANLIHPLCIPFDGRGYFHDTCSLLFHAIGGLAFSDEQLDAFAHFNFGTISDIVLPALGAGYEMQAIRDAALRNPELLRGCWRNQMEYYQANKPQLDGRDVIAPISPEDAKVAEKWNLELCCGNRDAMLFCDIWYSYCHSIDDLVDTMQDGRPVMSKDQIISLFFKAAILYNSTFYKQHRDILFPIVLSVTNTYSDSVAWEKSPKSHLRAMGDVFRTCGNEIYKFVALICGGEQHMKNMGRRIMERDWLGQHDANGNPT